MADIDPVPLKKRRPRKAREDREADSPDPIEIAMKAVASGADRHGAARNVLEKHARLIDCQAELAKAQVSELRLRHVGEGVRAILWGVLAIAAAAILALIVAVVIRASRSDALVVQSFRVPPSLVAKGLTGEVVATQVLDKLAEMQASTYSGRAASSYANNWEDELKIEIPNTGANTDQMWKLLRGWLGKETRISGEIIETKDGLALTTRVGSKPGQRFLSATADLDALITQGSELIFKHTQPYRHAIYLGDIPERESEREGLLRRITNDPSPRERKWAYNGLAIDALERGDWADAVAMAKRSLAIDPAMLTSMANLASAYKALGHEQALVDVYQRSFSLPISDEYDAKIIASHLCFDRVNLGYVVRDPRLIDEGATCIETTPGAQSEFAPAAHIYANLLRNDLRAVMAFRQPVSAVFQEADAAVFNAEMRLYAELIRGPSPGLAQALDAFIAASKQQTEPSSPSFSQRERAEAPVEEWPVRAEALALLGRHTEAAALIARTPLDCYTCVRVRGLVAQAAGNAPAAQRWFAEAARQGPRLAPAFADWGRLLAEHRRFDSAKVKLKHAVQLAPNWADPLKYWGDSLAAQGKRSEALAKYDAALKLAPNWAELRLARNRLSRT